MDWQTMEAVLPIWVEELRGRSLEGRPAQYIPELAGVDPQILGVAVMDTQGRQALAGDCPYRFSLQSVSKVFTLLQAILDQGTQAVFEKVGMEPTGDFFNSIRRLEEQDPKPLNPMINAGAIAVTSMIRGKDNEERLRRIMDLISRLGGGIGVQMDERVYQSESRTGDRNRSLGFFLRDQGILRGDVEEILDLYFRQCALSVNCTDLSRLGLALARHGCPPGQKEPVLPPDLIRLALTFMVTCGMYNASGEWAIKVGIPAKSGVSGAIMGAVPHKLGVGVIGPALDPKGNSVAGWALIQRLSQEMRLSIF